MKALFDSNVIVSALVETHPFHLKAIKWLTKVKEKEIIGVMSAHSIAEVYSTLTNLPIYPKISPELAHNLICQNVLPIFEFIELRLTDYKTVLKIAAQNRIIGGTIYDSLISHAAYKANVDKLLTFNTKHFKKAYPLIADIVEEPH